MILAERVMDTKSERGEWASARKGWRGWATVWSVDLKGEKKNVNHRRKGGKNRQCSWPMFSAHRGWENGEEKKLAVTLHEGEGKEEVG